MRIKQISVANLFRTFTYTIPLNLDKRITIIYGPNGYGKSTLLRVLNGFLNSRYYEVFRTPFDEFCLTFEDDSFVRLVKPKANEESVQVIYSSSGKRYETELHPIVDRRERSFPLNAIEDLIPDLSRAGPEEWVHTNGSVLTLPEVLYRYSEYLPPGVEMRAEEPEELRTLIDSIDVHMIEAQRLSAYRSPRSERREFRVHRSPVNTQAVVDYSQQLAKAIDDQLTDYAILSQSLDRTFPSRLIQRSNQTSFSEEDIHQALSELERRRSQLREVGLLEQEEDISIPVPSEIDATTRNVLSVYIEDTKQKLSIFDEMAAKIELLREIVNSRFKYKQMTVSKEGGFVLKAVDGQPVPTTSLSSGEQHTLVVFYELLFRVKRNSMILIDEPELSLHVEWQVKFLPVLQRITELSSLDVIMATHSPDIIGDRWDLTVELEGPAK